MNWTNPPHWLFPAHHCLHASRSLPPMLAKSRPLSQSRPEWSSNSMSKTKKEYLLPPAYDASPRMWHGTSLAGYQSWDLPSRVPDMGPPFPGTRHGTSLPVYQTWDLPSRIPDMGPTPPLLPILRPPLCYWHVSVITENLFKLVQLRTYPSPHPSPPVLISSGGCRKTYCWQSCGSHPTGKLCCLEVRASRESQLVH